MMDKIELTEEEALTLMCIEVCVQNNLMADPKHLLLPRAVETVVTMLETLYNNKMRIKYLIFDVEATRRERDKYCKQLYEITDGK